MKISRKMLKSLEKLPIKIFKDIKTIWTNSVIFKDLGNFVCSYFFLTLKIVQIVVLHILYFKILTVLYKLNYPAEGEMLFLAFALEFQLFNKIYPQQFNNLLNFFFFFEL